jgi:hypothetical protein
MNFEDRKKEQDALFVLMSAKNISESNMLEIKSRAEDIFGSSNYYSDMLFYWANKNHEQILENPELVDVIGNLAVVAMQRMPSTLGLAYGDKFSNHKISASIVYAHRIKNPEMIQLRAIDYLDRLLFIDIMKKGPRSEFITAFIGAVGISKLKFEAVQASVITQVGRFMKKNDVEIASIIIEKKDLSEFYLQESPSTRLSIFNKMTENLDRITLSQKYFPGMARLLIDIAESLETTTLSSYTDDMYANIVRCVTKMGAKPTYRKLGVLNEVVLDLLSNHGKHFTPTDSFMAAKSMNYSPEIISAIKKSPATEALKLASENELFTAIRSTIKTEGTGLDIVNLLGIKLTEKQLYALKKKHLMNDLGM